MSRRLPLRFLIVAPTRSLAFPDAAIHEGERVIVDELETGDVHAADVVAIEGSPHLGLRFPTELVGLCRVRRPNTAASAN